MHTAYTDVEKKVHCKFSNTEYYYCAAKSQFFEVLCTSTLLS